MNTLKLRLNKQSQSGFTIVELLIVIVVIGILAAITIVSYNGVQLRARDNIRRQDVSAMAKATAIYISNTDDRMINSSTLCGSHGAGYWTSNYSGNPSVYECVSMIRDSAGATLPASQRIQLPRVDPDNRAYMKANCTKNGQQVSYILTNLRNEPANAGFMETICDGPQASGAWSTVLDWDTAYGMNYGVQVPYNF